MQQHHGGGSSTMLQQHRTPKIPQRAFDYAFLPVDTAKGKWPPDYLLVPNHSAKFPPPGNGPRISDILFLAAEEMLELTVRAHKIHYTHKAEEAAAASTPLSAAGATAENFGDENAGLRRSKSGGSPAGKTKPSAAAVVKSVAKAAGPSPAVAATIMEDDGKVEISKEADGGEEEDEAMEAQETKFESSVYDYTSLTAQQRRQIVENLHAQLRAIINCLDLPKPVGDLEADEEYRSLYQVWGKYWTVYCGTVITTCDFFDITYLTLLVRYNPAAIFKDIGMLIIAGPSEEDIFRVLCRHAAVPTDEIEALLERISSRNRQELSLLVPSETGLGFLARCNGGAREEEMGIISFACVTNDRLPSSTWKLLALKNIFSRQLPKMPREYIVRLVFDVNHYTTCISKGSEVVGGCCFRPFFPQKFAEIAFLAVTNAEQVKGYGTRIMSHLKEHVKRVGIRYFLTYADNFAVGYFKKQGFTTRVTLSKSVWAGHIKDYDGGTLMECEILPHVNYLKLPKIIADQKARIRAKIAQDKRLVVYPGLDIWKKNPGSRPKPENIPGFLAAGWNAAYEVRRDMSATKTTLSDQITQILDILGRHENSWPFRKPVSALEAADYYTVIKEPMDLLTMRKKAKNGQYTTKDQFKHDVHLMFENCRTYNHPSTIYYKYANELETYIEPKLAGL